MDTHFHQPEDVAHRVLRRVQVSKMTRALQDRLALANVKMQHGWENMSLDAIEPKIDDNLRLQQRKRPASSNDTTSDAASSTSSRIHSSRGRLSSSPLTAPMFSDELSQSGGGGRELKRIRSTNFTRVPMSGSNTGRRARIPSQPWKSSHNLPQSSPIKQSKHARFDSNHMSNVSFASETSTVVDEQPPSPDLSEEDDADLPVHSFSMSTTRITSSPPRTPSPARRLRKAHNVSWSRTPKTGEEGADLLIYLATSPSAIGPTTIKPSILPPTTPPCRSTPLPSSHMTPGMNGSALLGFGPTTPGTTFNFADFVNVTPSPAQGAWSARTPVAASRTPGASARRKLNFESLVPPTSARQSRDTMGSPTMTRRSNNGGLVMELGGELVS